MATDKEVSFKKFLSMNVKKLLRKNRHISVSHMSRDNTLVLDHIFYVKTDKTAIKQLAKKFVSSNVSQQSVIFSPVNSGLIENYFKWSILANDLNHWRNEYPPLNVLFALMDTSQFKRGKGGKSSNAIRKWYNGQPETAGFSDREVECHILTMLEYDLICYVKFTKVFWYRPWLEELAESISSTLTVLTSK
jgi:hypothetical protein